MTLPDKTNSSKSKRTRQRPVRSTSNNRQPPAPRTMHEDITPTDTPLYRVEPDRKLQHRALPWVVAAFITTLACICFVAIVVGSVPGALVAAATVLALAILGMVRHIFPRPSKG